VSSRAIPSLTEIKEQEMTGHKRTQIGDLAADSKYFLTMDIDSSSDISDQAKRNRLAIIKGYEAQYAGDWDTWWNLFDQDVQFTEAPGLPYAISVKGLEAAKQGVAGMFSAWTVVDMRIHEVAAAGNVVILKITNRMTSRKTGQVYEFPVCECFEFRNGKVVDWTAIYWDTHEVRKVCGME
jgi:ketosteroid isomerase-like protein